MPFDTADRTYQDLLASVLRSDAQVVPFVGAGLSVYGTGAQRLPLWRELLKQLIEQGRNLGVISKTDVRLLETALKDGRYIEATDTILGALGEPTFKRIVEQEFDDEGKDVPPAVAELVAIGWSLIVTTNLDRMIARAYFTRHQRPINRITNLDVHRLAKALAGSLVSPETALAQIHGDVDTYPSWKLTRSHYDELLQDPGYVQALTSLFLRRIFFVGFGLQDGDFDFVLRTIATIYPAGGGVFYALIARSRKHDPAIVELIKTNGLQPIFYDVDPTAGPEDPFSGHREVFECLQHLATAWATARNGLDVTLKYFPEADPDMIERDREVGRLAELILPGGGIVQVVGLGGIGKTSLVQQFLEERRPQLATGGYRRVFGCSFYRADIGQFITDLALSTVGIGNLSLPEQVDRVCEHVRRHRTLLVLDGFEAVLDAERELCSPYLVQIIESIVQGNGAVLIASRVPARGNGVEHAAVVDVGPFSREQVLDFLRGWELDHLGNAVNQRLFDITAGHPLALRILAGVLRDVPVAEAITTIEDSAVIDLSDEVDPLRENRLARILGSYCHHLSDAGIAYLECATAFDGPMSYPIVSAALTRHYPDESINELLVGCDLRPVVQDLLTRRLLAVGTNHELSSHPAVREYFAKRVRERGVTLSSIHRFLAAELLQDAPERPDTFKEATPLIRACRHAAASRDWTLFDDLYRRRLMRGYLDHLCDTLGAWEETLELARLGEDPSFPIHLTPRPGYYPIAAARCLKHLGRSGESRSKYLKTLQRIAPSRDEDTAMYVNNFLTLLVWRGELTEADRLVELNMRALSWIKSAWKRHWQIEHGCSSIAYLRLLQGHFEAAANLFDRADHAWDDYSRERSWIYDYYPYHRGELILLTNPGDHDEALAAIESLLMVADAEGWPESVCRGNIQAALIHLDRARHSDDQAGLSSATHRLDQAWEINAGMNLPDVAIVHGITRFKVELARAELDGEGNAFDVELGGLVERVAVLVEGSGLGLCTPEIIAARGMLAYLEGAIDRANAFHEKAAQTCRDQGNVLTLVSPRSLVHELGCRLRRKEARHPTGSPLDVATVIGTELTPEWMRERVAELGDDDQT